MIAQVAGDTVEERSPFGKCCLAPLSKCPAGLVERLIDLRLTIRFEGFNDFSGGRIYGLDAHVLTLLVRNIRREKIPGICHMKIPRLCPLFSFLFYPKYAIYVV